MPSISKVGFEVPASPIRRLVPFAEKAKKEGVEVLQLNIGQPDIESPKVALEAVKNADISVLEYSHSAGFASYRERLAAYYQQHSIDVDSSELLITTGGSEALLFGFLSCFNPGEEIIIPEPFYANYASFAMAAGVKVIPLTTKIENGFALPATSEIEALITTKTKGILICNPGNPTGYLYTNEELEQVRDIVKKHDLFLFADEVYREFVYDKKTHKSVMELDGISENTILVDSVSKRYSMCGARIGALITKNKDVYNAALKFAQARLSPPTLAQIASEAALNTPVEYFERVNQEYVNRRDLMENGLNSIDGVFCPNPSGAFYCVAKLPVENAEDFCIWMLEHFRYKNHTVMMAPASGFYISDDIGLDEVRIAYVLKASDLEMAITCIEEGLKAYQAK